MSVLEENIIASVGQLASAAGDAVRGEGAELGGALDWLNEWSRQAASAGADDRFALRLASSLAQLLNVSHCAVARADKSQERLFVDLRRAGSELQPCTIGEMAIGLNDADSLFAAAARSSDVLCVDDLDRCQINDEQLSGLGLCSAAVMPLSADTGLLGAIALCDTQARRFGNDAISLLEAAGHLTAATLSRASVQAELQRQREMLRSLRGSMESAMLVISPDGTIADVNPAACGVTGFEIRELVGRSIWSALLVAEDLELVKQAFARLHKTAAPERFESYVLNKNGERRRVSWSMSSLQGDDVSEPAIICTGIDITERCEAVERAVRAEAAASGAQHMFTELQQRLATGEAQMSAGAAARRLPGGVEYDRRARSRREYPYYQLIAPLRDGIVPAQTAFAEMKCHDISSRGFSFVCSTQPDFDRVVVAFGTAPTVVYLAADIRHATKRTDANGWEYVVGCRYTGRLREE